MTELITNNNANNVKVLIDWIKKNGGSFVDRLKIEWTMERGFGGFANGLIHDGESLTSTPKNCIMSSDLALKDLISNEKYDRSGLEALPKKTLLALYLVLEKRKQSQSFWFPYISCLPSTIDVPLLWSEEEKEWLNGTNLGYSLPSYVELVHGWHSQLRKQLSQCDVALDEFNWAYSIITSRAFPGKVLGLKEEANEVALLPLHDIFNHKNRTKITWLWDSNKQSLSFVTGAEIQSQQEISNNYGPKSNEELLNAYGFCMSENEFDYVRVRLNLGASQDPLFPFKNQLLSLLLPNDRTGNALSFVYGDLQENASSVEVFRLFFVSIAQTEEQKKQVEDLLLCTRILVMNDGELETARATAQEEFLGKLRRGEKMSFRNEFLSLDTLIRQFQSKLNAIKQMDQPLFDLGIVEDPIRARRLHSVVVYREGQKNILRNTLSLLFRKLESTQIEYLRNVVGLMNQNNPTFSELYVLTDRVFDEETLNDQPESWREMILSFLDDSLIGTEQAMALFLMFEAARHREQQPTKWQWIFTRQPMLISTTEPIIQGDDEEEEEDEEEQEIRQNYTQIKKQLISTLKKLSLNGWATKYFSYNRFRAALSIVDKFSCDLVFNSNPQTTQACVIIE